MPVSLDDDDVDNIDNVVYADGISERLKKKVITRFMRRRDRKR